MVKWLQFFLLQLKKKCSHVTVIFGEIWPQLSTFCSHISNYDCNFQHFALTFRIMTAKCWKLQSRDRKFQNLQSNFELWLQLSTFCSHISNYDCKMLKVAVTWLQISNVAITSLQLSTNCNHNSKFDCNFWNLQSPDCNF